jgi:hypothetical protein
VTFHSKLFLRRRVVSPTPNPAAGGPHLVGSPRYILSCPAYLEAISSILSLRTRHAVVTRDPLSVDICNHRQIICFLFTFIFLLIIFHACRRRVYRQNITETYNDADSEQTSAANGLRAETKVNWWKHTRRMEWNPWKLLVASLIGKFHWLYGLGSFVALFTTHFLSFHLFSTFLSLKKWK